MFLNQHFECSHLSWVDRGRYREATIGNPETGDGVTFTWETRPTCYRRGIHLLRIEVAPGHGHEKWGCFDDQDQPTRNFHNPIHLMGEAEAIAAVLKTDRAKRE